MRGGTTIALVLTIAFASCSRNQGPTRVSNPATDLTVGPCTVLKIVDGDTVRVNCNKWVAPCEKWPRVRLLNLDTPERSEAGYAEALAALETMVAGEDVYLTFATATAPTCGRYHRLLAYLFVGDENINVEMVRAGWSPYWKKYGKGRYPEAFEAAEAEATGAGARTSR